MKVELTLGSADEAGSGDDDEDEDGAAEETSAEEDLAIPTKPLTRLRKGSAHKLLLQAVVGSRVKQPV